MGADSDLPGKHYAALPSAQLRSRIFRRGFSHRRRPIHRPLSMDKLYPDIDIRYCLIRCPKVALLSPTPSSDRLYTGVRGDRQHNASRFALVTSERCGVVPPLKGRSHSPTEAQIRPWHTNLLILHVYVPTCAPS